MSKTNAIFQRSLTLDDFKLVENIFYRQWTCKELAQDKVNAPIAATWFCASALKDATFGTILFDDQKEVIGFCAGQSSGKATIFNQDYLDSLIKECEHTLNQTKSGQDCLLFYKLAFDMNQKLYQQAKETALYKLDAKLILLWVDAAFRGQHLSSLLLNQAKDQMLKDSACGFYLFTDTNCSVNFYQRKPWQCLGYLDWPNDNQLMQGGREYMFYQEL